MADHVVLAEVAAGLDRDKGHWQATRVLEAVGLAKGDVDGFAFANQARADAQGDFGGTFDDDPVFGAVEMRLQRRVLAREEDQGPDAEAGAFCENWGREDRGSGRG